MPAQFTDTKGRGWILPALTVAKLSEVKAAGGVDLWAVVQGNGKVGDDLGKLARTFRLLLAGCAAQHNFHTEHAMEIATEEVMSDGDNIFRFEQALNVAITGFFPSATRATWSELVAKRGTPSISNPNAGSSSDSPATEPAESPATSTSSGSPAEPKAERSPAASSRRR